MGERIGPARPFFIGNAGKHRRQLNQKGIAGDSAKAEGNRCRREREISKGPTERCSIRTASKPDRKQEQRKEQTGDIR